jgi:hypothetical protein
MMVWFLWNLWIPRPKTSKASSRAASKSSGKDGHHLGIAGAHFVNLQNSAMYTAYYNIIYDIAIIHYMLAISYITLYNYIIFYYGLYDMIFGLVQKDISAKLSIVGRSEFSRIRFFYTSSGLFSSSMSARISDTVKHGARVKKSISCRVLDNTVIQHCHSSEPYLQVEVRFFSTPGLELAKFKRKQNPTLTAAGKIQGMPVMEGPGSYTMI